MHTPFGVANGHVSKKQRGQKRKKISHPRGLNRQPGSRRTEPEGRIQRSMKNAVRKSPRHRAPSQRPGTLFGGKKRCCRAGIKCEKDSWPRWESNPWPSAGAYQVGVQGCCNNHYATGPKHPDLLETLLLMVPRKINIKYSRRKLKLMSKEAKRARTLSLASCSSTELWGGAGETETCGTSSAETGDGFSATGEAATRVAGRLLLLVDRGSEWEAESWPDEEEGEA